MSANNEHAQAQPEDFEPIAGYERLIELRATSPDAFMLQSSEATRRALVYYERQKAQAADRAPTPPALVRARSLSTAGSS